MSYAMDFDPLSFFEPEKDQTTFHDNTNTLVKETFQKYEDNRSVTHVDSHLIDTNEDEDTEHLLTVLDLPQLNNIPFEILKSLLCLFQPDQVKNFGNKRTTLFDNSNLSEQLTSKNLTVKDVENLGKYLGHSVESTLTLSRLPLNDSKGLTAYFTKIIASPFVDYTEDQRDQIYDLVSYVMTANSAPALKGNTTRLVEIDGLDKEILLYEPALTEDNIGNITWGASLELAKLIVNRRSFAKYWLDNNTEPILELGAGTGLVTIVLRMLKYSVVSTDLPEITENLGKNLVLNNLHTTDITFLDWRSPDEFLERMDRPNGYKTIILSDPVYSPQHPYWVQGTVKAVLSKAKGSRVVFMVGRRDRFLDVRENMWRLMIELGLSLAQSEVVSGFDDYGVLEYDYKVFEW